MAKYGRNFYINYLKSEYAVHRDGPQELVRTLNEHVVHKLKPDQLEAIEESNKLAGVDEDVLYSAAEAIYITQQFKKLGCA